MFDIVSDLLGGMNELVGGSVIGLLAILQIPLIITWIILTLFIVYYYIFQRKTIVLPSSYTFNVSLIIPYADKTISVYKEKGALCTENGIKRFSLKNEKVIMQKPDTADLYPNKEIMVVSLGPDKKFNGRRLIDYENKIFYIDVETPKVAQLYFAEKVKSNDPNFFYNRFTQITMMIALWVSITIVMAISNMMAAYPFFVKAILWG